MRFPAIIAALTTAVMLNPAPASAQARIDPMAATVAQWFTMIEQELVPLADAMPADKYGFKPTNGEFKGVRTFAEQVKHVACANFAFYNEIEKKTPPANCETGGPSPAKTKAELMAYLRESFAYAGRVLRTMTPANAMEPTTGPYPGGPSTRLGLATLSIWHASDHYGQMVVYLRMNGIVPPAHGSFNSLCPVFPETARRGECREARSSPRGRRTRRSARRSSSSAAARSTAS